MPDVDVVVYGTICLDLLWRVDALPPPGGYAEVLEEVRTVGGEAANTAIALAKWGARVALVGNDLGQDDEQVLVLEMLEAAAPNIDRRWIRTSPQAHTPYCICMATADGERTMFGHRFATMHCAPLDPSLARSARAFTVEPNAYQEGVAAARVASAAGCFVAPMDYARDEEMNRLSDWIVTSSEHVGRSLGSAELQQFAQQTRDQYDADVIVTQGPLGQWVARSGERGEPARREPAFAAPAVVDTTGSGDIFRAGLLFGFIQEWDLDATLRFASAAAALNCGAMGGWCGVRSLEETRRFADDAPFCPGDGAIVSARPPREEP